MNGLAVCVGYAAVLALSIDRWAAGLDSLTVVTDAADAETADLGRRFGVRVVRTNRFYEHGAAFNKGSAMEEALRFVPFNDWVLFFDADIVPPRDWWQRVEREHPQPGNLYGAKRYQCDNPAAIDEPALPWIHQDGPTVGLGYFQLFHGSDPLVQKRPLMDCGWRHAGGYDNTFKNMWPESKRIMLPLRLVHVGPRHNWCGIGNPQGMASIWAERMRQHGTTCEAADSERL